MTRINSKIVSLSVVEDKVPVQNTHVPARPSVLHGTTYKVVSPVYEHAMYVTINDLVEDGKRRPFEMFVNSKNMEHYQWIVALTRTMSAVFRHGGDVSFLVEELKSVFDPKGGYFKKGGKWMPSLVAEIGEVVEEHLLSIGLPVKPSGASQDAAQDTKVSKPTSSKIQCQKCLQYAVVISEGCRTCMSCGDSKCS